MDSIALSDAPGEPAPILVNVPDAAKLLSVHPATVRTLIRHRTLTPRYIGRHAVRLLYDDLRHYAEHLPTEAPR